jgi:hypothetical protein
MAARKAADAYQAQAVELINENLEYCARARSLLAEIKARIESITAP